MLPSKSHLHRLLICAALSENESVLSCGETEAEDILATIACLNALGAQITREAEGFAIKPLQRNALPAHCILPCGESGSTLRFLLPVVCALGVRASFQRQGRLPERPLAPLDEQLCLHGCRLWEGEDGLLCCEGHLLAGKYCLPGNVSSQYISGLLFALPLLDHDSSIDIAGVMESADYVSMTCEALECFGAKVQKTDGGFAVSGGQRWTAPDHLCVEGDWSNAAFWLCAGALPGGDVICHGLLPESKQGDRIIASILKQMGAKVCWEGNSLHVMAGSLHAVTVDARAIPDLVPALACVMALAKGESRVTHAGRLRLKESDRLAAVAQVLNRLGAQVEESPDGLRIQGVPQLHGACVDAWGDHRIAMLTGIAASVSESSVTLLGAEAVRKSYPDFWQRFSALGGRVKEVLA